jgi:hypothetical protein
MCLACCAAAAQLLLSALPPSREEGSSLLDTYKTTICGGSQGVKISQGYTYSTCIVLSTYLLLLLFFIEGTLFRHNFLNHL